MPSKKKKPSSSPKTKAAPSASSCLDQPTEMSATEYADLLQQIQNDLTLEDCQIELLDAARYNDIDICRALLQHNPLLLKYQHADTGNTALHMAAANGHVAVVELLLQVAAAAAISSDDDAMTTTNSSDTPHIANIVNAAGNTALHWAAANGQQEVVQLLTKLEFTDVLQRNQFGRSALTEGFASENQAVVGALLEHESASEEKLLQTSTATKNNKNNKDNDTAAASTNNKEEVSSDEPVSVTHALVLGRHTDHPTCHLKIRELAMASDNKTSILGQESPDQDTTGFGIWAASLVAAQWMNRLLQQQQQQSSSSSSDAAALSFANKRVLELGAGCGVPGLVVAASSSSGSSNSSTNSSCASAAAAAAPPSHVYLTDFNPTTVANLRHNVQLNGFDNDNGNANNNNITKPRVEVLNMNWQDPKTWPNEKIDILIGSDLIYQSDMVPLLTKTIRRLLVPVGGVFLYVAPSTGRKGGNDLLTALVQQQQQQAPSTNDDDDDECTSCCCLYLVSETVAPADYFDNPLQSQDDEECFLHFHELMNAAGNNNSSDGGGGGFKLYQFQSGPPT